MAKKKLKAPNVPPGARRDFFIYIQRMVLEHGDPSVATIAEESSYSHQTVYKALTGPQLPARQTVLGIAKALNSTAANLITLWTDAVAEQRSINTPPPGTRPTANAIIQEDQAYETLYKILNQTRESAGSPPLATIAQQAGLSRSTVTNAFRNGSPFPNWGTFARILDILEIDPSTIEHEIRPLYVAARDEINREKVTVAKSPTYEGPSMGRIHMAGDRAVRKR